MIGVVLVVTGFVFLKTNLDSSIQVNSVDKSKMSSTRPTYAPRYGSRDRDAARERHRREAEQRKKEEEERRKLAMNQTNFPSLAGSAGWKGPQTLGEDSFADKALEWDTQDKITKMREDLRATREADALARERVMMNGIYVMSRSTYAEEPVSTARPPQGDVPKAVRLDEDGFQQVRRKERKEKRELTEAEIAQKYAHIPEEDDDPDDHNAQLFEKYRREHY